MSLRRDLAAFEPAGTAQREAQRQMADLLAQSSEQAFRRDHLRPGHFTASGFVVSPDGRSLLLIFHKKLERWLQPGGHFELGDEDHLAAARREVAEEVGLSELEVLAPLYDLDVHAIPANAKEGEHLHFDLRVLFRSKSTRVEATSEVLAARYFSLEELTAGGVSSVGSDESVARVARRLLGG
jgi:8-oxo-dGTP pyrophosphatase MutT (NUDIX family)